MAVLRTLGALVIGSLVIAAAVGLAVRLLDRRNPAATVEDDYAEPAPERDVEFVDPTTQTINTYRSCCVPRDQINPQQIEAIERELAERWPELRSLGRDSVA